MKLGDTVQLKSGGPIMTINAIGTPGNEVICLCCWFVEEQVYSEKCNSAALRIVESAKIENIKKGDVVRLRTGSPLMTVNQIHTPDNLKIAICHWFSGNNHNEFNFNTAALIKQL